MSSLLENSIKDMINNYDKVFFHKSNVIGVGLGVKNIKGMNTKEPCLHVLVKEKVPLNKLNKKDIVPSSFLGIKTDIINCGGFKLSGESPITKINNINLKSRIRPIKPGINIAAFNGEIGGTLGAIVFGNKKNTPYILSCNHILADNNELEVGEYIVQPEPPPDYYHNLVAFLSKAIRLDFEEKGINIVDAAIAEIPSYVKYTEEIPYIGKVKNIADPYITMRVRKTGCVSGYTEGVIKTINTKVRISNIYGEKLMFKDQIIASYMSEIGDSGSIVVDSYNNAIGLLMGLSKEYTIINPITKILNYLNVHFN
ncbi:hypothetical protein [Clostridium tarantellae]|uniref:Serine protease n=1 Tax=Clostridium tarantellae TaxID=39493 RepID=A0A6I1MNW5_9CLOT|nr:hypothetical protein [Clostridium tarantellae]MPQ43807.1 hypothetical protein [Clostridium tarantellae]